MEQTMAVDHDNVNTFTLPMRDVTPHESTGTTTKTLLDLPTEILRRICEFLLSTREVNRGYVEYGFLRMRPEIWYDFQTAIMRTNRALYNIARSVFAANHVIHVSSSDYNSFTLMFGSEFNGPILQPPKLWTQNIKDATDIRMKVYFDTSDHRHLRDHAEGLLFIENLEDLVAIMAANDIAFHNQIRLSICVNETHSGQSQPLKLQRALLEPFKPLHGITQNCTIRGSVEPLLAEQMEKCLTLGVHWYRATKWVVYQSVSSQAKLGYEAYSKGEYGHAFTFYRTAAVFTRNIRGHNVTFKKNDDAPLWHSFRELCDTINHNAMASGLLSCLSLGRDEREEVLDWVSQSIPLAAGSFRLRYLFDGTAALGLNSTEHVKALVRAATHDDPALDEALQIMRTWYKQSPKKRKLTAFKYFKQLSRFISTTPTEPEVPISTAPSMSASIDYERYILRALGYQGDLYEDRILQKEGCSSLNRKEVPHVFDQAQADLDVEWYRRKLAAQKAAGEMAEVWISSEIGKPELGGH